MRRSNVLAAVGAVAAAVSAALPASVQSAGARSLWLEGSFVAWPESSTLVVHATPESSHIIARVRKRTEFGGPASLAVVGAAEGWAEVISTKLPNGEHGYVRLSTVHLTHTPIALEVDLSRRLIKVWRLGAVPREIPVGIGSPVSPTPTGRFAVTDKLYGFNPAAYGCCILALSAHQEHLAPGWPGGDRLAIHVGSDVGANSNGCLRASTPNMRWLMTRVPLGTQIVIHP